MENNNNNNNKRLRNDINQIYNNEDLKIELESNYRNYSTKEIRELNIKFGLPTSGTKEELASRLIKYINIKSNLISEVSERESISTFKEPIELVFKDIEPLEELFWRIFRNKFLFNKIFSNFSILNQTYSYDRIHDVEMIFDYFTNGAEIIRDKVKSNQYLSFKIRLKRMEDRNIAFYNMNEIISSSSIKYYGLNLILKQINQNSIENIQFYNNLIKNYTGRLFTREKLIYSVLETPNKILFDLINPSQTEIDKALTNNYLNSILYSSYKDLKFLNYIIFQKNIRIDIGQKIKFKNINIFDKSFKLKHLINSIQLLSNFIEFNENNLKQFDLLINNKNKFSTITNNNNNYNNNNNLNSSLIDLLKSSSKLFKSKSPSSDVTQQNNLVIDEQFKNYLFNLVELYYNIIQDYYNGIGIKYPYVFTTFNYFGNNHLSIRKPIIYYLLFKEFQEIKENILTVMHNRNITLDDRNPLDEYFEFIKLNKHQKQYLEIDLELFNELYESLCIQPHILNSPIMKKYYLKSIIRLSDLEVIDYFIKKDIQIFFNNLKIVLKYIQSTKVLEYFYLNHQEFLFKNLNGNWMEIRNLKVQELYEKLMMDLNRKFSFDLQDIQDQDISPYGFNFVWKSGEDIYVNNLEEIEILLKALKNSNGLYEITQNQLEKGLPFGPFRARIVKSLLFKGAQELFIEIIKTKKFKNINLIPFIQPNLRIDTDFFRPTNRLSTWLFENSEIIDITNTNNNKNNNNNQLNEINLTSLNLKLDNQTVFSCQINNLCYLNLLLYSGNINTIIKNKYYHLLHYNEDNEDIENFFHTSKYHLSVEFLNQFLNDDQTIFNLNNKTLADLMNGNLHFVKCILLNINSPVIKQLTSHGFFKSKEFLNLLNSIVIYDQLEAFQLLSKLVRIDEEQYLYIADKQSLIYEFLNSN